MKVIDTHTHLPGSALGCTPRSAAELRPEFEKEGLSGAWLMTVDGLLDNPARHNDVLAESARDHLDFFAPFCTVQPHMGAPACLAELDRAAAKLGMRGVKLHPWLQAFSMTHPAVAPIFRRAGELGLPVLLHDGTPPYSSPLQVALAAEQAPGTTVILGHAGLDDLYEDAILACLRHPNIYLCLCSLSAGRIREILKRCPTERLLFGSDGGLEPGLTRSALAKFLDVELSPARREMIFHRNAQRLVPAGRPGK